MHRDADATRLANVYLANKQPHLKRMVIRRLMRAGCNVATLQHCIDADASTMHCCNIDESMHGAADDKHARAGAQGTRRRCATEDVAQRHTRRQKTFCLPLAHKARQDVPLAPCAQDKTRQDKMWMQAHKTTDPRRYVAQRKTLQDVTRR